jgi:hypothetical protein
MIETASVRSMEIPCLTLATLANSLPGTKREFSNKPLRQKAITLLRLASATGIEIFPAKFPAGRESNIGAQRAPGY